ncbi:hypothetical protein EJ131_12585 [Bacillus mycoides]|nr:hypothetical protein [Bacillus mycoides]
MLRITKRKAYSFDFFVFTSYGAEKGSDRFYAWLDPLSPLKRQVLCRLLNFYIYIALIST